MPRFSAAAAREAALLVARAVAIGDEPLAFPESCRPATPAAGRRVAAYALAELGLVPVGLRLAPGFDGGGSFAGPVIESRLLRSPAAVPPPRPGRRRCTLAVAAQLAAPLPARGRPWRAAELIGRIASLHPALDLAETRFAAAPADAAQHLADLAGLGLILVGPAARAGWQEAVRTPRPARIEPAVWRGVVDVAAALQAAAEAARAADGLPAGAVLVAAGLSPELPDAPTTARIARLGAVVRLDPATA